MRVLLTNATRHHGNMKSLSFGDGVIVRTHKFGMATMAMRSRACVQCDTLACTALLTAIAAYAHCVHKGRGQPSSGV